MATGLLQHESRLSVLNFAVRKAAGFAEPLPNKAPLLFVTGLRCGPAGGRAGGRPLGHAREEGRAAVPGIGSG